jgi:cell division protein FtsB
MKRKPLVVGFCIILVSVFFILFFSGDQGIMTFYHSGRQVHRLKKELNNAHSAIDSLTSEINRLKNDTIYLERIAREKFGMARRDEKMYKFIEEK